MLRKCVAVDESLKRTSTFIYAKSVPKVEDNFSNSFLFLIQFVISELNNFDAVND